MLYSFYHSEEVKFVNLQSIKPYACCFTGHRIIQPNHSPHLSNLLLDTVLNQYNNGFTHFLAGGALGFDTIAALSVINARINHPDIKLILILPCKNQSKGWNISDINTYHNILSQSDNAIYSSESYVRGCMFKRNRMLVDNSSICISYQYKETGGTAYTTKYATSKGLSVFNLFEDLASKSF